MQPSNIPRVDENPSTHRLFSHYLEAWQFCRNAQISMDCIERINWKNWGISLTLLEGK